MRRGVWVVVLAALAVSLVVLFAPRVSALTLTDCQAAGITDESQCQIVKQDDLNYKTGATRLWQVMQVVFGLLGGIAVIMIIVGGIRYALSEGDPSALSAAKNTILYSVIGLVVAIAASGIVLLVQQFFLK